MGKLRMADQLHEDVILKILERLPIKSLIRFTCVSKRWRFIILSDDQFAKSQFRIACDQPSRTRVLLSTDAAGSDYESLGLETPLDADILSSSVVKLSCPFKRPNDVVSILSSCNGLVLTLRNSFDLFIWNPSTGFFKKLPQYSVKTFVPNYFGLGHISATDDYKVIIKDDGFNEGTYRRKEQIFSWRANTWKTIHSPSDCHLFSDGFLLNETLHWHSYNSSACASIVAFDLATEVFRTIPLPAALKDAKFPCSFTGLLCVLENTYLYSTSGSIGLWVMREYDVADSWVKLFNISVSIPIPIRPRNSLCSLRPILVTESNTLLRSKSVGSETEFKLIRSVHHQEEKYSKTYTVSSLFMSIYEESLLWLH